MEDATRSTATRERVNYRVNYVDWLRAIAVLLLIPFHTARLFDQFEDFYVKNSETNLAFSAFVGFLGSWQMPLLFVLAGAATWFALGFRSPVRYVFERLSRLVIPLIFGVLVVVPPQMYFAQRFHGQYGGSYLDFYPGFLQFVSGSDYPGIGFSFAHLWFILFLFWMSMIALPFFVLLRTKAASRVIGAIAHFMARPGMILLAALSLPLTAFADDPMGHNFTLFIILFAYGYLLMSNAGFQQGLYRSRWIATGLGLLATAGYFAAALVWGSTGEDDDLPSALFQFGFNFSAWFWVVAFLGFGQRWLNAGGRLLRYANEAAYPVYILHQTVIVVIGYYVVQWPIGALPKFAIIAVAALVACVAIYDLVLRRIGVTRFLFGIKVRARTEEKKAELVKKYA